MLKIMLRNNIHRLALVVLMVSCNSKTIYYKELDSFENTNNLIAVIEIPVGTNNKIEYRPERNSFEIDTLNGQPRIIKFLAYPVNYGFVPSTRTSEKDLDPLDILVFAKPLKTGQIVTVRPIGFLKMIDDGEVDDKILSVPVNTNHQIIDIQDFEDLSYNHPKIRDMISDWFLNYDENADIQILGWFDETKAIEKVKALQIEKAQGDGQ